MKKLIATLSLSLTTVVSFSQSQNWWRSNGNTPASTDVLGTTNATPLNIVTNNVLKMVLDANGTLRLVNFAGTGNRIVTTDANGNLSALPQGSTGQYLSSNGTWQNLPAVTQPWNISGNNLFYNTGSVGIGAAPNSAYKLDVAGDARVQNNLYVGGGILISQKVEATNSLKTDTVRSASGSTKFANNVVLKQQFQVDGTSLFNGNLQATNLNVTGALANNLLAGTGVSKVYSNAQGVLFKGPFVPAAWECVGGSPNWNIGGNNFNSQAFIGITVADIGTCDDADFILKSNGNPKIWLKNTGGNEYVGFGTANPQTNFHFSGGNVAVDGKIGVGTTSPNTKLEVVDPTNAQVCIYSTSNNTAKMFVKNALYSYGLSIDGNAQTNSQVNGHLIGNVNTTPNEAIITWDGLGNILLGDKTLNTQVNTGSKLNVKSELNKLAANFISNHNASYGYNTLFTVNQNLTKAIAVQNTATGPAIETFRVFGNGQTQIGIKSQNTIHSDALLNVYGKMVSTACYIRTTDWADYVFAKDYKLPNLYDVEKYYIANKHLPEIPSEKEVLENGIDVAEMNKLLLKKIEEMTILMVKQQKQIDALEVKIK